MAVTLTFLGHSAALVSDGTNKVIIDPFLTGNPQASASADDIDCQAVVLTHGHADHFGDTLSIARRTGATVHAAFEICEYISSQGHEQCAPSNPGGRTDAAWGWVAFTQAFHSSSFEGKYMGMPCGAVVHIGGKTIYHAGDTDLFSDMKLIGEIYKPDVAMIPMGDIFTMGPELATRAAEFIGAPIAVPIHYKTFPVLRQNVEGFSPKGVEVRELAPGESMTL